MYTYFIRDLKSGLTKIGRTRFPKQRIGHLQFQAKSKDLEVIGFIEGDFERREHIQYSEYRVRGEWFNLPEAVLQNIRDKHFRELPADGVRKRPRKCKMSYVVSPETYEYLISESRRRGVTRGKIIEELFANRSKKLR